MDLNKKIAREMRKLKDEEYNRMADVLKQNDSAYEHFLTIEKSNWMEDDIVINHLVDAELTKLLSLNLISAVQYEKLKKMSRAESEMRSLAKATINNLRNKRIKNV